MEKYLYVCEEIGSNFVIPYFDKYPHRWSFRGGQKTMNKKSLLQGLLQQYASLQKVIRQKDEGKTP
jgi:hypothetical protein